MDEQEQERFLNLGWDFMTDLAQVVEKLDSYAATFEARGGTEALGVHGNTVLEMIYLRNDLAAFLDAPRRATLARLRTDY